MMTLKDVRTQPLAALRLDDVGPRSRSGRHAAFVEEVFPFVRLQGSLSGVLAPVQARTAQGDEGTCGNKKKPRRYRWPDEVHDEVLARLLDLNQKRYEEEVAAGLHDKGKPKAAPKKTPTSRPRAATKKTSTAKGAQAGQRGLFGAKSGGDQ